MPMAVNNTMVRKAHAQIQTDTLARRGKLSMTLKTRNTHSNLFMGNLAYDIANITSILQKFVLHPQNETIQYDLNNSFVSITDSTIWLFVKESLCSTGASRY